MTFCRDFYQQCPTCDLDQPAPNLQPSRVYAGSSASQPPFLLWAPRWPETLAQWRGHLLLAATSLDGQSWWHCAVSPLLLGWRGTGIELLSPGGFMQLMVEQMGICHHDTVGQTCCKPKSPEPLSWGLNPAACPAGRLGTTDSHGEEEWMWVAVTPPQPLSYWENLWGMKANWKLPAFFLIVYIQVYNCGSQPTLCSYINQNLVRNITEENSDQLYVYHSPLEGEKEKKRKRKTAWFFYPGNKSSITFNKWYTCCFCKQILLQIKLVKCIQML